MSRTQAHNKNRNTQLRFHSIRTCYSSRQNQILHNCSQDLHRTFHRETNLLASLELMKSTKVIQSLVIH